MLTSKQRKCVELMAVGEHTQKSIAVQIKITEQTICAWKKNPEFMAELEALIRIGIQSLAAKAFRTQRDLLDANNEMVRFIASKDILDRAGYKPKDKLDITVGAVQIIDDIPNTGYDDESEYGDFIPKLTKP